MDDVSFVVIPLPLDPEECTTEIVKSDPVVPVNGILLVAADPWAALSGTVERFVLGGGSDPGIEPTLDASRMMNSLVSSTDSAIS